MDFFFKKQTIADIVYYQYSIFFNDAAHTLPQLVANLCEINA